jgi:hypothetical protein
MSLGDSVRIFLGGHDDSTAFAREGLISEVSGDSVELNFDEVILNWGVDGDIEVEDVLWICRRFDRLSARQWSDAFRAAGYSEAEARPFIETLRGRVQEGLALARRARS